MLNSGNIEALLVPAITAPALLLAVAIYVLLLLFPKSHASLRKIPGPLSFSLSSLRMIYADWRGQRARTIKKLHDLYGPVVRIGSNEVSFTSLSALRTIYGAGSSFERTPFYQQFDVYGHKNLFTFGPSTTHRERKKLLSHAYANRTVLSADISATIEEKVAQYLTLLEQSRGEPTEIFSTLHYFSLDAISTFVYGPEHGGTTALLGNPAHLDLLSNILNTNRRKLAWFAVHLPSYNRWPLSYILSVLGVLPMSTPSIYGGIRAHGLAACTSFVHSTPPTTDPSEQPANPTVLARLRAYQLANPGSLSDLDIASECADHLLAGIDTTADTLLFLIWTLSLPQNHHIQSTLRSELQAHITFNSTTGVPAAKSLATLPYLNAIVRETLRLFSPLPGTEPRVSRTPTTIDGFTIPANTIVGVTAYVQHRDSTVYAEPSVFEPQRWLVGDGRDAADVDAANRHFWAFSSGARMCIGMHLAMAEMLTLVAAVYGRYRTVVREGEEDVSPGITSRFEVFWDESKGRMVEHECWIKFERIE